MAPSSEHLVSKLTVWNVVDWSSSETTNSMPSGKQFPLFESLITSPSEMSHSLKRVPSFVVAVIQTEDGFKGPSVQMTISLPEPRSMRPHDSPV